MSLQKKSYSQCRAESAAQWEQTPRRHNIRVFISEMLLLAYQRSTNPRATLLPFALQLIPKSKPLYRSIATEQRSALTSYNWRYLERRSGNLD